MEPRRDPLDFLLRLPVVGLFGLLALGRLAAILGALHRGGLGLARAGDVAVLLFLVTVALVTALRLAPARRSGWRANLAGLAGSFLSMALAALPPAQLPQAVQLLALALVLAGGVLSFHCVSWLGRAFSILPEARTLVTAGPYAIIRHPLYLSEELMVIGAALMVASWGALALAALHWAIQLWRMRCEEAVLSAAFPEDYPAYAARVPRLIPTFRPRPPASAATG